MSRRNSRASDSRAPLSSRPPQVTGPDIIPFLPVLLPPILAAFSSPEWMTRKAGAQVVQQVATSVGSAASAHKEALVGTLEKHRFDKVGTRGDPVTSTTVCVEVGTRA